MREIRYGENGLPRDFAGGYVAWIDDQIVMMAETYDELSERLQLSSLDLARVVVGYVEPYDVVRVY